MYMIHPDCMETSAGSGVKPSVGDTVGRIFDLSPNRNHLEQATAGSRPTLRWDATNLKYYLEFDGTTDLLVSSTTVNVNAVDGVYMAGAFTRSGSGGWVHVSTNTNNRFTLGRNGMTTASLATTLIGGSSLASTTGPTTGTAWNTGNIVDVLFEPGTTSFWENGVPFSTASNTITTETLSGASIRVSANNGTGAASLTGLSGAFVVLLGIPTSAQRFAVHNWIRERKAKTALSWT